MNKVSISKSGGHRTTRFSDEPKGKQALSAVFVPREVRLASLRADRQQSVQRAAGSVWNSHGCCVRAEALSAISKKRTSGLAPFVDESLA